MKDIFLYVIENFRGLSQSNSHSQFIDVTRPIYIFRFSIPGWFIFFFWQTHSIFACFDSSGMTKNLKKNHIRQTFFQTRAKITFERVSHKFSKSPPPPRTGISDTRFATRWKKFEVSAPVGSLVSALRKLRDFHHGGSETRVVRPIADISARIERSGRRGGVSFLNKNWLRDRGGRTLPALAFSTVSERQTSRGKQIPSLCVE